MMTILTTWERFLSKLEYDRRTVQHRIKPLVDALEELHPAVARAAGREGPWLEYPWRTPLDSVSAPCEHLPGLETYRSTNGNSVALLIRFATTLINNHDRIFAA